jgi:hypothetical protein
MRAIHFHHADLVSLRVDRRLSVVHPHTNGTEQASLVIKRAEVRLHEPEPEAARRDPRRDAQLLRRIRADSRSGAVR